MNENRREEVFDCHFLKFFLDLNVLQILVRVLLSFAFKT